MKLSVQVVITANGVIDSPHKWEALNEAIELFRGASGAGFQDIKVEFKELCMEDS